MVALETPEVEIGMKAPDFSLKGVDGKIHTLANACGKHGLVVMFICNHCPYVQAIADKIVRDARELAAMGVATIAINSNDTVNYPDDSYENMKLFATKHGFNFPYVIDETQNVAKGYGAVCTPDFFGFNANLELQYRGRLDDSRMEKKSSGNRELFEAMKEVAITGKTSLKQYNSIGCNIKWKN